MAVFWDPEHWKCYPAHDKSRRDFMPAMNTNENLKSFLKKALKEF